MTLSYAQYPVRVVVCQEVLLDYFILLAIVTENKLLLPEIKCAVHTLDYLDGTQSLL